MKKILLCSPSPNATGGIARWTKRILANYSNVCSRKIELKLMPMDRSNFHYPEASIFFKIKTGIIDYFSILKKINKEIKTSIPHVLHVSSSASLGLFKDVLIQKMAKRNNVKNIIHFHFGRIPELKEKNNWEWKLLLYVVMHADIAIVIDRESYNVLINHGLRNVKLVPNPVSFELLEKIDKNKDVKRLERKILFAGQLIPSKGVFELVEACTLIPDVQLKMIGKPKPGIVEQLLELANTNGNNSWLEIEPEQSMDNVIKEMLSASVFVLPTYTEGFPNVILESMACGCPIVASSVGAIPEMLNVESTEVSGLCVKSKNVEDLRNAIVQMLENRAFAECCGENAKKRVLKEYSMPTVWEQLNDIWLKDIN